MAAFAEHEGHVRGGQQQQRVRGQPAAGAVLPVFNDERPSSVDYHLEPASDPHVGVPAVHGGRAATQEERQQEENCTLTRYLFC